MKTNIRVVLSIALSRFMAFFILLIISGCTLEDRIPPSQRPIIETNTVLISQSTVTCTPSSLPNTPTAPELSDETPILTTNTPVSDDNHQLLGKNMVAIKEWDSTNIHLVDLDTGYMRKLLLPTEYHPIRVLAWSNNGCELALVTTGQNGVNNTILQVDLQGNITQYLLSSESISHNIRNFVLSPSQEWIAYRFSEGEYVGGFDPIYEFENIEVISVGGAVGPYRLTQGNGGREVAWAPDSMRLAYGDFDENGIPQLYISNLDGTQRVQRTHFDDPLVEIRHIQWSPQGDRIAFAYTRLGNISSTEPRKTDVMVVSAETGEFPKTVDRIYLAYSLWWQGDDTIVVWGYEREYGAYNMQNEHLFWVDADTCQVVAVLEGDTTPEGYMINPQPFGISPTIGYVTDHSFYSYDYFNHSFTRWDNILIGVNGRVVVEDWNPAPGSFQGEAACQP